MQDNKDIANIDEQFTNLAWEKMQGLLDKEIPVTPVRKRRWGWLWLLLFLGIIATGTYYNFVIKNAIPSNQSPDAAVADIAENTNVVNEFEDKNEATTSHTNDFPKSSYEKDSPRKTPSDLTSKVTNTDSPKITSNKEVENNIAQNNLHIKKENNFIDTTVKQDIFFTENKVKKNVEQITNILKESVIYEKEPTRNLESTSIIPIRNSFRNSSLSTERIAILPLQTLVNNHLINNILHTPSPVPEARKFSQTYSLTAGGRSDEFNRFGGVNAGLLAHYRFTPKVGLETGLMYAYTRKNIRANIDYTNAVNQLYPNNTIPYITDIEDIHNYNYFRLPLSLTYRPYNKVQLAMGLNAGYRFDKIITKNYSADADASTLDNSVDDNTTYESEIDVYVEELSDPTSLDERVQITVPYSLSVRKWDLIAQAGVRYYPISRLGIDISYQYGLLNMTPKTDIDRNSGIQLALVWQLHR